MGFYTITSHSGNGLRLNVATTGALNGRTNVNITNTAETNNQRWLISSLGTNVRVKSTRNILYMLNASSTSNCDVYTQNTDTQINFISLGNNIYRIQLGSNNQKYLTVDSQASGTTAKWEALNTSEAGQKWKVTSTTCSHIMVNTWLTLQTRPTGVNGRNVSIPNVSSYTGADGYTYSFTNKNYWYAWEPGYSNTRINSNAVNQIRSVTGSNPTVIVGTEGEYKDSSGNYWMAVGPNVVNPNHASNQNPTPEEMYARGKLDIVVKDENNTLYYVPGVVGDTKMHTWNNGIIQTNKAYPDGLFESAGCNFNGCVCAEFIGSLDKKMSGLGNFSIVKIIFYET